MNTLTVISQFIRWRDWGAGKITVLWSLCLYMALAYEIPFGKFALTFLVFLIFAATQSALGYVLNDWGDRELDRRQFKRNAFNGKSTFEIVLSLSLMLIMSLVTGLPFALRPGFGILWFAWVAAAASYSIEPVRLKTKGAVGLVTSFVAQWFLPVLLAFAAFEIPTGWDVWALALALTISGATLEVAHQRYDRQRDLITKADTFAVVLPEEKVERMYALALLFDKLAVGVVVGVYAFALFRLETVWSQYLSLALLAIYGGLLLLTVGNSIRALRGGEVDDPYYARERTLSRVLHETMLNLIAPVFIGVAVSLLSPLYGIILALFLIWRIGMGGADLLWPLRAIKLRTAKSRG